MRTGGIVLNRFSSLQCTRSYTSVFFMEASVSALLKRIMHNRCHLVQIIMPKLIYYEHSNTYCVVLLLQHFDIIVIKLAVKQRTIYNSNIGRYSWPLTRKTKTNHLRLDC